MNRLDLTEISDVRCEASETRVGGSHVLVLAFFGSYRDGSQGSPDATRMAAETLAALAAWRPDALVFDLRGLRYRWGDGMMAVFAAEVPDATDPVVSAVVVGPDSRAGLASLCSPEALFEELEVAIAEVARRAREATAERERLEDLLVLPVVLRADLAAGEAVQAAARAVILAREHWARHWTIRAWVGGTFAIRVLAGSRADLAWAREALGGISVQMLGAREELGVVVAPQAELPARLAGLPLFG